MSGSDILLQCISDQPIPEDRLEQAREAIPLTGEGVVDTGPDGGAVILYRSCESVRVGLVIDRSFCTASYTHSSVLMLDGTCVLEGPEARTPPDGLSSVAIERVTQGQAILEEVYYEGDRFAFVPIYGPMDTVMGVQVTRTPDRKEPRIIPPPSNVTDLVDLIPDPAFVTDANGHITYANRGFSDLTGWPLEDLYGQTTVILSAERPGRSLAENIWNAVDSRSACRWVLKNKTRDGRVYHEDRTIGAIRDSTGLVSHFIGISRDVTPLLSTSGSITPDRDP